MDTYKRHLVAFLLGFSLLSVTLVAGFELIIFNDAYFEWHYTNRDIAATTGMTVEDLMVVTDHLLDYITDKRDNLDMTAPINGVVEEVFGQREKDHMVDVKGLYLDTRNLRRGSFVILLTILLGAWYSDKQFLGKVLKLSLRYIPGMMGVLAIVGGLFASNFDKYFTLFHELFFDNDLWLLDPKTDIMINMVPEAYFYSVVMIGLGLFVLMTGIALALFKWGSNKLESMKDL